MEYIYKLVIQYQLFMPQIMYIQIMMRIQIEQIEFIYLGINTHRNTHTHTSAISPSNNTIKEKQPINFKESKETGYMGKFTEIKWKR